jgi:hypothetical protein
MLLNATPLASKRNRLRLTAIFLMLCQLVLLPSPAHSVTKGVSPCQHSGGLAYKSNGHSWYLSSYVPGPADELMVSTFGYGTSWYSTLWPLFKTPVGGAQVGLASTWIQPTSYKVVKPNKLPAAQKRAFTQSIEGSLGWWGDTAYRQTMPKFEPGATINGYSSGAREFWASQPIASDQGGWITLTNQILLPPEGMTFTSDSSGKQLGQTWLSLPFPKTGSQLKVNAGVNAWTLFLNGENFKGPLAYVEPNFWALSVTKFPNLSGYTFDNQMGMSYVISSEWGSVPYCEVTDSSGDVYSRIPDMQFPVDSSGRFIFARDYRAYSNAAIATQLTQAISSNGPLPSVLDNAGVQIRNLAPSPSDVYQGPDAIPSLKQSLTLQAFDGGAAVGFDLGTPNSTWSLPTYFKQDGNTRVPISKSSSPQALQKVSFAPAKADAVHTYQPLKWYLNAGKPASKVINTKLLDGSTVSYRWYKFVDQPLVQRFKWTPAEKAAMQSLVVKMQRQWASNPMQSAPSGGTLASFDKGILVKPPKGLEYGYVPIVVKQTNVKKKK